MTTGTAVSAPPASATPLHADTDDDAFIAALTDAGIPIPDRASAINTGKSVCPKLSDPAQDAADVAAKVADSAGMPLGPATRFTGLAVSIFCPALISKLGKNAPPRHKHRMPRH